MKSVVLLLFVVVSVQPFSLSGLLSTITDNNENESAASQPVDFGTFLLRSFNELYSSGHAEFAGYSCTYSRRPDFKGIKLIFKASFSCPGISMFTGKAQSSSPSGSVRSATGDFARKAVAAGEITEAEAGAWLTVN